MMCRLRRARRAGMFTLIAAVLLGLMAPAAAADTNPPPDLPDLPDFVTVTGQEGTWTTFEAPIGRVYGNATNADGFVAITGGTLVEVCTNTPPPVGDGRFRQKNDGTWVVKTNKGGIHTSLSVYETDLDVFAFFDQQCPLFFSEDPAFAEPFATGEVVLRDKGWNMPEPFPEFQPPGRYKNSIRGDAVAPDGTKYKIRAVADYELGTEPGPPTFFRDFLKVRELKH